MPPAFEKENSSVHLSGCIRTGFLSFAKGAFFYFYSSKALGRQDAKGAKKIKGINTEVEKKQG